jgi:hypothetical protein
VFSLVEGARVDMLSLRKLKGHANQDMQAKPHLLWERKKIHSTLRKGFEKRLHIYQMVVGDKAEKISLGQTYRSP